MRCAKCGYVSFDYLSECKKCRTNLTGTREGLGFLAAKPAAPSLLGSLLSDYEHPVKQDSAPVENEISTAFAIGDGFGGGFWQANQESQAPAAAAVADPDESEEDFSLLDLSDQELELLIDNGPFSSSQKETAPESGSHDAGVSVSEFFPAAEQEPLTLEAGPVETPLAAGNTHGIDNYLTPPDNKAQTAPTGELIPKFIGDLPGLKRELPNIDPAQFEAPPEQAEPKPDGSTDDFVIELSENDLESLLKELNSTTKGEAEQN
jgi:hypothetical protein